MMSSSVSASSSSSSSSSALSSSSSSSSTSALVGDRAQLYSLILSQLRSDALDEFAAPLAQRLGFKFDSIPQSSVSSSSSSSLLKTLRLKRKAESSAAAEDSSEALVNEEYTDEGELKVANANDMDTDAQPNTTLINAEHELPPSSTWQINSSTARLTSSDSSVFPVYTSIYTATHKAEVRCAAFSADGQYVLSGSMDSSVKVMEVARIHLQAAVGKEDAERLRHYRPNKFHGEDEDELHPVLRTMYHSRTLGVNFYSDEHGQELGINDLDFHPWDAVFASAGNDRTVKLFDIKRPMKQAFKAFQDTHRVRSVNFHASGDFILLATEHPWPRILDLASGQSFVLGSMPAHHTAAVNMARYSTAKASLFVTVSSDGNIKLWDTVSGALIRTIRQAHGGAAILSVCFSPSGRFILTAGRDSTAQLFDVSSGRLMMKYGGVQMESRPFAVFVENGEFIMAPDQERNELVVWNTRNGDVVNRLAAHVKPVRAIVPANLENSFVTCGDDQKVTYWTQLSK